MYKDPTEFRARFKAYKEGKMPYENGLPRYAPGKIPETVDDATLDFIINHEGFKPNTWVKDPVTGKMLLGSGIDVNKYKEQFRKTGKWSAEDNRRAVRDIVIGNRSTIRRIFGDKYNSLTQAQKGVIDDIAFNIGAGALANSSPKFVAAVLSGNMEEAKRQMDWGNHLAKGLFNRNKDRQAWWGTASTIRPPKYIARPDNYDYETAEALGYQPDGTGHWPSRNYVTGEYLKSPSHPTMTKTIVTDIGQGYNTFYNKNTGRIGSNTWMKLPKYNIETGEFEFPFIDSDEEPLYKNGKLPHFEDGKIKDMKLEDKKDLMWYAKPFAWKYITNYLPIDTIRERLYNNLIPVSYKTDKYPWVRARDAIVNNEKESLENFDERQRAGALARDEIYAQYLHIPKSKRRGIGFELEDAKYRPTLNDNGEHYYSINFGEAGDEVRKAIINNAMKTSAVLDDGIDADGYSDFYNLPGLLPNQVKSSIVLNDLLGWHRVGRAIDPKKGDYISYWDRWDLTPVGRSGKDLSMGIGTPVNIYDRIYLDDYYGVDSSAPKGTYYGGYLPEIEILPKHNNGKLPKYKNGKSPIHIKPANRGKLTRLKARTGKSESELYNDGNPAHKKMVVFARNARKWKH